MPAKQDSRLHENPHSLCVRVLKERYYPDGHFLAPGCPTEALPMWLASYPIHLVCDLIDRASGAWDSQLVRQSFYPPDADAILAMPQPRLAWESSGIFLVKSAYR